MPGLIPTFNFAGISSMMTSFVSNKERRAIEYLGYLGEAAVNAARSNPNRVSGGTSFTDRSGNLRSSIGYIILKNGETIKKNLHGILQAEEWHSKVDEFILTMESDPSNSSGLILVVFAAMEYAAAVEALGFDVISSTIPMVSVMKKELKGVL